MGASFRDQSVLDSAVDNDFGDAQAAELIDTFLDGKIFFRPALLEFLDQAISQHHHKGMPARACFQPHMNRAQIQLDGFAHAEILLHQGQVLIAIMHHLDAGLLGGQIGFNHVTSVEFFRFIQRPLIDA